MMVSETWRTGGPGRRFGGRLRLVAPHFVKEYHHAIRVIGKSAWVRREFGWPDGTDGGVANDKTKPQRVVFQLVDPQKFLIEISREVNRFGRLGRVEPERRVQFVFTT